MMTAQAYSLIIEEVVYLNSQEIPRIITAETIPWSTDLQAAIQNIADLFSPTPVI